MMSISSWWRRALAFGLRDRLDDELRDEIDAHIALRREQLIAEGVPPHDTLARARQQFGNVTRVREESRVMWSFPALDTIVRDLAYAVRMMRNAPAFTLVATLSLGVGMGGAAAVFGLADSLLLRELPVSNPRELAIFRWSSGPVSVFESLNGSSERQAADFSISSTSFSHHAFTDVRRTLAGRADVFGFAELYRLNLSIDGRAEVGSGQVVSGNYYSGLGLAPASGRLIAESDDRPDAPSVAVISHTFWRRWFGGANAVGRPLALNGIAFTIIGVAPAGFRGTLQVGQDHDVIVPMSSYTALYRGNSSSDPNYWWVLMMARVRPGIGLEEIRTMADLAVKRTTAAARPQLSPSDLPKVTVEPGNRGQTERRNALREPLKTMALVVGIVLLVACANVANLMLARGRARTRELTIRVAIGAARSRVVRQLMTEGLLLALAGGALGLLMAKFIATALLPALSGSPSLLEDTGLYWRAGLFTLVTAFACTLLFGVVPALRATDIRLASGLREATRGGITARFRSPLTSTLVVVQVTLSMLLVTVAALLAISLRSLERVDPGFDASNVLIFRLDPRQNGYEGPRARNLLDTTLERLRSLPGVRAASFSSTGLIGSGSDVTAARPAGTPAPEQGSPEAPHFIAGHRAWRMVTDDAFLATMGIQLRAGRTFTSSDKEGSPLVAVVNESLAKQLFGRVEVIGERFMLGLGAGGPPVEIIGVSADAKYMSLRTPAPPTFYVSYRQRAIWGATFFVRSTLDPATLAGQVRDTLRGIAPDLPVSNLRTQREQNNLSIQSERLFARLATLLGAVTLLLAAIGLYGLLSYSVTRRVPELGLRMALGADRISVMWLVLRQSLVLVGAGLVIGIPAALASGRFVSSLLFDISPRSPTALIVASAIMLTVALIATLIPARRASRVDPMIALRAD